MAHPFSTYTVRLDQDFSYLCSLPPGCFIYLRHLCGEYLIEPVEGTLVKERASLSFAVIARPFGIVETNQLLLRRQSIVDPLGVPRQRIALGPGKQRRAADLASYLLEAVILGELQVLRQGADSLHPEASLDNGPAKRWGLLDVLHDRLQHLRVDVRELLQHVFREGRETGLRCFEHVPQAGVGYARGQAVLATRRAWGQVAPEADPHERDLLRVDLRARQGVVHHRLDDVLPVRAHDQALFDQHPALPRAVEKQQVVAAAEHGREIEVQLVDGRVVAVRDDEGRPRPAGVIDPAEVPGQCGPL